MAKEKQMTLLSVNVYNGDQHIGTLSKEVPDYAVEQEYEALLMKANALSVEPVAPSGLDPVVA
ncbi:hypothetical protein N9N26_00995 [Candidatus Poseidoniales archaeon]|jgi:hypothetical protein|nr:hypothetical protein [Candidatus Poseidoniales archaeon]